MTDLVKIDPNHFAVDMPNNAPPLGFDPAAAGFSWRDVYPSNYWNVDMVKEKYEALGGWPVYTPAKITIQPVEDPEDKKPDLSPKIVLHFVESVPALVFNKTRCTITQRLTGTPNPALWAARLPKQLILKVGTDKEFSAAEQVLIEPATPIRRPSTMPDGYNADDFNRDFFGE